MPLSLLSIKMIMMRLYVTERGEGAKKKEQMHLILNERRKGMLTQSREQNNNNVHS